MDPGFTLARFAGSQPYRDPAALARLLDSARRAGLGDREDADVAEVVRLARPHAHYRRRVAPRPRR